MDTSDKSNDKEDVSNQEIKHEENITETISSDVGNKKCDCYFPRRYMTSFLAGVGMMLVYAMRTNIGVTAITLLDERSEDKLGSVEAIVNLPTSSWTTRKVALLHSAFYLGYIVTHIPGGCLTMVFPCNRIYGICILVSAVLNITLPYSLDHLHYTMDYVIRFAQGLSEGLLYPSCYGVLRHWSTPAERGRLVSAVLTGSYAGAIIGFPFAGLITHYINWEYVYYVSGGACICWSILWLCCVKEKPSHDYGISDEELDFLNTSQGNSSLEYENVKVPWKSILTSLPVIAVCVCHFTRNWVFILMLTNEPYYLNNFGFSVAENGLYSSIPHIFKVLAALLSGFVADFLLAKKLITTSLVRKLLTAIGYGGQATFLLALTFTTSPTLVLIFLTFGVGMFGLSVSGWQINHYDLATRYAGILVSLSSGCGGVAAIIVPYVAGELTADHEIAGWNRLFYITIGILVFTVLVYSIFGSGKEQIWAHPPPDIQLIQKEDPLARKPYHIRLQQRPSATRAPIDLAGNSDIKSDTEHSRLVKRFGDKTYGPS